MSHQKKGDHQQFYMLTIRQVERIDNFSEFPHLYNERGGLPRLFSTLPRYLGDRVFLFHNVF